MVSSIQILGRLRAQIRQHGFVALLLGTATLAGCGQKGPLFLPVPPVVPATAIPTTTINPATVPASPASAPP